MFKFSYATAAAAAAAAVASASAASATAASCMFEENAGRIPNVAINLSNFFLLGD